MSATPAVIDYTIHEADRYKEIITMHNTIQSISITLFFYYCVLNIEDEVTHIWLKKWTWGKVLYLTTRYLGALFNLFAFVSMVGNIENVAIGPDPRSLFEGKHITDSYLMKLSESEMIGCLGGYLYTGLGVIPVLFAEGILALRVYAIYNKSKRVLIFLAFLLVGSLAVNILQTSDILNIIVENTGDDIPYTPFDASLGIVGSCSFTSQSIAAIAWAVTVAVEFMLFIMVLKRSREKEEKNLSSSSSRFNLLTVIARDSSVYFGIIFACTSVPTFLSFLNEIGGAQERTESFSPLYLPLNPLQAVVITSMTLLAPQMIVNLRHEYHQRAQGDGLGTIILSNGVSFHSQELSWNAQRPQDLETATINTTVLDC